MNSWTAASDPFSWPNNWNPELLAHAFGCAQPIESYLNDL